MSKYWTNILSYPASAIFYVFATPGILLHLLMTGLIIGVFGHDRAAKFDKWYTGIGIRVLGSQNDPKAGIYDGPMLTVLLTWVVAVFVAAYYGY